MTTLPKPWTITPRGELCYDGVQVVTLAPRGMVFYATALTALTTVSSSGYIVLRFKKESAVRPKDLFNRDMRKPGETAEQFKEHMRLKDKKEA